MRQRNEEDEVDLEVDVCDDQVAPRCLEITYGAGVEYGSKTGGVYQTGPINPVTPSRRFEFFEVVISPMLYKASIDELLQKSLMEMKE